VSVTGGAAAELTLDRATTALVPIDASFLANERL
jgi:hypothetical protein